MNKKLALLWKLNLRCLYTWTKRFYLYAFFLFGAMALLLAAYPFKGQARLMHAPHSSAIDGHISWRYSDKSLYTLINRSPAPDYSGFESKWHPQKKVMRVSLFFRGGGCPRSLFDHQGEVLGKLKSCRMMNASIFGEYLADEDNDVYRGDFDLSSPLGFGAFRLLLQEFDGTPAQIVQPESSEHVLFAVLNQCPKFGDLFRQLWGRGKFNAVSYLFSLALLGLAWVLIDQNSKSAQLLTLASIVFSFLGLVPKFSGNDETAHFSMLLEAAAERLEDPASKEAQITRLNIEARNLMFVDDFFKLHKVDPPREGACLHQIIGSCGISEKPKDFYKTYFRWATINNIEALGVGRVLTLVRLQNLLTFFMVILLSVWLFGLKLEYSVPIFLIFASAFSTLISLSNDIFGVVLGVFLTSYQFWLMKNGSDLKLRLLATLSAFFLFYLGTRIDSNAFAALPVLAASCMYLALSSFRVSSFFRKRSSKTLFLIALSLLALAFFVFTRHFAAYFASRVLKPYLQNLDDGHVLQYLGTGSLESSIDYILTFVRGTLGQFVWSHTSHPRYLSYFVLVILALFTFYSILKSFCSEEATETDFKFNSRVIFCLMFQATLLALLIDSVGAYGNTTGAGAWSYLVTRFFFPGVAVLFVPILLAIDSYSAANRASVLRIIHYSSLSWATLNVLYFYPKFFLADAW